MIRSGAVNNYDAIIKATTEGKTVHCSLIHKGPCLGFCWGKASNVFKNNFFTYFMVHALPILLSKQRMREFVKKYSFTFVCILDFPSQSWTKHSEAHKKSREEHVVHLRIRFPHEVLHMPFEERS
eukprot:TRINITY_DN2409_c0_g1_i13.p3 TRINITY_DN2409_c0_g1~~TRINITY_DN2409_c0_g1_i13.p3  ORF type:complete len:125 (-),score=0.18 TRINITY_DN2409_c0_g1_i13:547-921(-)